MSTSMKHIRTSLVLAVILATTWCLDVSALTHGWDPSVCWIPYRDTWNVEASCNFPASACGYQVYGNISTGNASVNLPANCNLGLNLATNKANFGAGKISFGANSKMVNLNGPRYYQCYSYDISWGITNCPNPIEAGGRGVVMRADNSDILSGVQGGVAPSGTMCCAREGY